MFNPRTMCNAHFMHYLIPRGTVHAFSLSGYKKCIFQKGRPQSLPRQLGLLPHTILAILLTVLLLINLQGFIDKDKQVDAVRQLEKRMAGVAENLMKLLEKLDTLRFEEGIKGARSRRKSLVDRIQVILQDLAQCGHNFLI